jgi:DNA polymerase III subunit epsilon
MVLVAALVDAVRRHVDDRRLLDAIGREVERMVAVGDHHNLGDGGQRGNQIGPDSAGSAPDQRGTLRTRSRPRTAAGGIIACTPIPGDPPPMPDRPITAVPLAVLDVETTGLFAATGDRVCEIAVLRAEPDGRQSMLCELVDPGRPIEPEAAAVNGIRDVDLVGAPPFTDLIPLLDTQIAGAVLVAHNAAFDLSFLSAEYTIAGADVPDVPVLDTLLLARRWYRFPHNSLGAVATSMGIPLDHRHRAAGDVGATFQIFLRMVADLGQRGCHTVADFVAAQGLVLSVRSPAPRALRPPLGEAVGRRAPVTICYVDAAGRSSERTVEPLWASEQHLIAYCRLCKAQRTFRLDRIVDAWLA